MKYEEGTKLIYRCEGDIIRGVVVENFKLPGDICVKWDTDQSSSYDVEWLDEHTEVDVVLES